MRISEFRALPDWEQVEMIAHDLEERLRAGLGEHVAKKVAKMFPDDGTPPDKLPPGRRRR
jgi:hypothetical protein